MKVLSVDDSNTLRKTIANCLEVLNLEIEEAANGISAIKKLEENEGKFDLILLDWEMPEMDGYEFLETIKADNRYSCIPVIMLTSISQKEKMIDAVRAGASQYVTKPFTSETLQTKIIQTLGVDAFEEL